MIDHKVGYVPVYQYFYSSNEIPVEVVWFGLLAQQEGLASIQAKMEWRPLLADVSDNMRFAAHLSIYDDAFTLLYSFKNLFEELSQEKYKRIGSLTFCQLLKQHGFKDKREVTQG